jgi:RNA polymerase sigma-70 factor (ECF subfamily)
MPEPYREVFTLHVFGELTFKQIAEVFAKSESWAKMTYYRGKSMIVERLEGGK